MPMVMANKKRFWIFYQNLVEEKFADTQTKHLTKHWMIRRRCKTRITQLTTVQTHPDKAVISLHGLFAISVNCIQLASRQASLLL